jgi:hypothetical protein
MIGFGQRVAGESLEERGRVLGREGAMQGMLTLARVREIAGDTDGAAEVRSAMNPPLPADMGLDLLRAGSARAFLPALLDVLARPDLPPAVKWDLLYVGQVLVRCGDPSSTGVPDDAAWRSSVASRLMEVPGDRRILERIRAWPRDAWHCAGLADQYARGWRRPVDHPPIRVSWATR